MRIAYLHYLYGDDTALHHVRQFAAAAGALGHQIEVHAMNLAPQPLPAVRDGGWAREVDGDDDTDGRAHEAAAALMGLDVCLAGGPAAQLHASLGAAAAASAQSPTAAAAVRLPAAQRRRATSFVARARRLAQQRLGRYLHEPKELAWNVRYVRHELARLAAGPRPDVLLVRDEALTASTVVVAARLGLPLVYEINAPASELALYFDEYLHLPRVPDWLEGLRLRRADAVTTVSTALREYLVERHRLRGAAAEKITVVPNGADLAAFRPQTEPSARARRLLRITAGPESGGARAAAAPSLDDTRPFVAVAPAAAAPAAPGPVVGFVGSFQKFHGVELLIDMALEVAALRRDVRFLLVGDGPGFAKVRSRLAPLGERAVLTGTVEHAEVPGLVAAFDVGVLPETSFYACPLKVIEWMAAGKAVVAPRYGPLTEMIADGEEGLLFPPRDLGALVAAVLRLVDRPALRRKLGDAAAARAAASLSWTDNARRVIGVLEQARSCAAAAGRAQPNLSPLR
jgi:glycosyltransferase involved in cell wall biosynthesis